MTATGFSRQLSYGHSYRCCRWLCLFLAGPPLQRCASAGTMGRAKPLEALAQVAGGSAMLFDRKDPHFDTRLIGLAMLIGVLAAAMTNPRVVRGVPKAFFEGAGYAFAEVVSLIVIASCFGKAIEIVGFAKLIGDGIQQVPGLLLPVAGFVPLAFGALSGSGMAARRACMGSSWNLPGIWASIRKKSAPWFRSAPRLGERCRQSRRSR